MSSPRSIHAIAPSVEEKIRQRAYQLFEKRGGQHGRALDDWLQAEAELLRSKMGEPPARVATFKGTRPRKNGN